MAVLVLASEYTLLITLNYWGSYVCIILKGEIMRIFLKCLTLNNYKVLAPFLNLLKKIVLGILSGSLPILLAWEISL